MNPSLRNVVGAGAVLALGACTSISGLGGDSKYACKAPEGVACDSVSGTYANALHHNLPSQRRTPAQALPSSGPDAPSTAPVRESRSMVQPSSTWPPTAQPLETPLRSQARVLRLWIKPWEDADGDLYDQGYVYVQVDNGQWLIEHLQRRVREAYAPLRPPKPATGTTSAAPAGGDASAPEVQRPGPAGSPNAPFPSLMPPQGANSNRTQ